VSDKPWDDPDDQGPKVDLRTVKVGRLDSLTHDAAYFDAIAKEPIHAGQLDRLREYYRR
jgi:hypothetical protein